MLYTFEIIENEAHFHWHKHTHTHTTYILCTHANDLSPHCHTLSFILMLSVCLFALFAIVQSLEFWSISGFLVLYIVYLAFFFFVFHPYMCATTGKKHHNMTTAVALNFTHFYYTNKIMRTPYSFVQLFPTFHWSFDVFAFDFITKSKWTLQNVKNWIANNIFAK